MISAIVLLGGFALMMFATAIAMLRNPVRRISSPRTPKPELPIFKVVVEGIVVGAITGLVGAGGGFLVVPALVLLGGLPMELAVGTSLVVIAMKSFAGFAGFIGSVTIDWAIALQISAAAVGGSVVGGVLASRIRPAALRKAFGWFVIAMAFFILGQELPLVLKRAPSPGLAAIVALGATGLLALAHTLVTRRSALGRTPHARSSTPPGRSGPSSATQPTALGGTP
jgi:uncharacterized membrane protein YfcA